MTFLLYGFMASTMYLSINKYFLHNDYEGLKKHNEILKKDNKVFWTENHKNDKYLQAIKLRKKWY